MSKPPSYRILRKAFADGREEFRVRINRFGWILQWIEGLIGDGGWWAVQVFNTREQAEEAIRWHWQTWVGRRLLISEELHFDPEEI